MGAYMINRCIMIYIVLMLCGIAFATAKDSNALVSKVGDRSYDFKTFDDGFKAYLSYHLGNRTLTALDSTRLNDQYWEELIGVYVYDQAIKAGRISVSDAEIENDIIANPPDGVKIIKDFHTNGRFDASKYRMALVDRPDFRRSVIDLSRGLYSYSKLIRTIKEEAVIYPDSIYAEWLKEHNTADITAMVFDYSRLLSITANEADARQYYMNNLDAYLREEGRSYQYVRLSPTATASDDRQQMIQSMKANSAILLAGAREKGIAATAQELGFEVLESGMFSASDKLIPGIGTNPALVAYAFANPLGSVPDIYYAPNGDYYICEVHKYMAEYHRDFSSIQKDLERQLSKAKRMDYMRNYANEFVSKQSPATMRSAAEKDSLLVVEASNIGIDSPIPMLGLTPAFNEAILNTPEGSFTPLIEREDKWLLAAVHKRNVPDLQLWNQTKDEVISSVTKRVQQEHLNRWYLQERSKLEIIDKRHEFYPLRGKQPPKLSE